MIVLFNAKNMFFLKIIKFNHVITLINTNISLNLIVESKIHYLRNYI